MSNFFTTLLDYKDYFPILIVTVTAVLGYYFGKMKDNDNQKLESQEESLKLVTSLYLEIVALNKATNVDVALKKEFVKQTFKKEQIYKLYDHEVLEKLKYLYLEIIGNPNIDEGIINAKLIDIETDMKRLYGVRLKHVLKDYEIWNIKKNDHPFIAMVVIGSSITKKSMETILAIFSLLTFAVLMEFVTGSFVFNGTLRGAIIVLTVLSFLFWVASTIIYKIIVKEIFKKRV